MSDIRQIPLAAIVADIKAQPRAAMSHEVVGDYAEDMTNGATFPPVVVFQEGEQFWLADGFHRYHGAVGAQLREIAAEVRPGTLRDAILHSCSANAAHGLRRTNEDKRRAVTRLLSDPEWAAWSDREIARRCAVDHVTVGRVRPKLSGEDHQIGRVVSGEELDAARRERTVARGGTTYTQNTAAIGRRTEVEAGVIPSECPLSQQSVLDVFRSEQDRTYLWHAVEKALAAVSEIGDPAEAFARFPTSLAHTVRSARLRAAGDVLIRLANLWEAKENDRVRAAE